MRFERVVQLLHSLLIFADMLKWSKNAIFGDLRAFIIFRLNYTLNVLKCLESQNMAK